MIYNTHRDLGLSFNTTDKLVSSLVSETDARKQLPNLFAWLAQKGLPASWAMDMYMGEALLHELFWRGEQNPAAGAPAHSNGIQLGDGQWLFTRPVPLARGRYFGESSRFWGKSGTHSFGGTMLMRDNAKWKDATCKLILRTSNWGIDTGHGAWAHHVSISDMWMDGNLGNGSPWMSAGVQEDAGIGLWDGGETCEVRNIYFNNFGLDGLLCARGTPVKVFNCSAFRVGRFGFASIGSGKMELHGCSGDEQGLAFAGSRAGYGRPGSSHISAFGAKQETGTSDEFAPFKGSALFDCEDWSVLEAYGVDYSATKLTPYCLVRVKSGVNSSRVTIDGIRFFGNPPKVLLYDDRTGDEYNFPTGENAYVNSVGGYKWDEYKGFNIDFATVGKTVRKGGRLTHIASGSTDWSSAKIYDPTGGPGATPPPTPVDPVPPTPVDPVPPTPVPPSAVTPARFAFSSGTAATLTSAEGLRMTQVAGTASVASGKLTVLNNPAGASASWTCNLVAKTVTILNFVPSAAVGGQYIFSNAAKKGIVITDGGGIADNTGGSDRMLYPVGTLVAGRNAASLVLTMSTPTNFVRFGATEHAGNCMKGSIDEIRIS